MSAQLVERAADYSAGGDEFKSMDDLDPSTGDGHRVVYDRECPFELRLKELEDETPEIGTLEAIKVKLLVLEKDNGLESIKIELSSENDLFFYYMHVADEDSFRLIQEHQKLMIDFEEYPNVLIKMLNNCIKEPHKHLAVFVMTRDGRARLDFIQNMEYKFLELLSADFVRSPDDVVRRQISYRYNALKSKMNLLQARQHDVFNLVKSKNPSLLLQLQAHANKGVSTPAPAGSGMRSSRRSRR